ncbi:MAG TPA: hypothetical protein VH120_03800, partial [Gemmataceae bacterium]|nr:hypothetical protein [Gemmataceae bacterium]
MSACKTMLPALAAIAGVALVVLPITARATADVTEHARRFIAAHESKVRPLEVVASLAWWNANVSGKDEDFKRKEEAQNRIDEALSNRAAFAELKSLK